MKKSLLLIVVTCLTVSALFSQTRTIRGTIVDKVSSEPLSFASIAIKNTSNGTFSNDDGIFELKVKEENAVIQISYIGYKDYEFTIEEDQEVYNIFLEAYEVQLDEVVVRPHEAIYYIKKAIENHPNTITSKAFETRSFYSEKSSLVNDKSDSYKMDEAVFVSYFPDYSIDTLEAENRLVLHEYTEKGEFESILLENRKLKKRIAKSEKREKKRKEKKQDTSVPAIDTLSNGDKDDLLENSDNVDINFDNMLGGPAFLLGKTQDILDNAFFEKDRLKKFKYTFAPNTTYQGRTLMAIDFYNKKKIEFTYYKGTIYLDYETLAIVSVDYTATAKIPFYINALIKGIAGFKLNKVFYDARIRNQTIDGKIYPKQSRVKIQIDLESDKRIENIAVRSVLNVEDINLTAAKPIDPEHIFDSELEMADQIFNLENLKWDDVGKVEY